MKSAPLPLDERLIIQKNIDGKRAIKIYSMKRTAFSAVTEST
jgi:hypothetical protein